LEFRASDKKSGDLKELYLSPSSDIADKGTK
jgi:hypothetical protein